MKKQANRAPSKKTYSIQIQSDILHVQTQKQSLQPTKNKGKTGNDGTRQNNQTRKNQSKKTSDSALLIPGFSTKCRGARIKDKSTAHMSGRGIFNQSRMNGHSSHHEPPRLSLDQQGISTRWLIPVRTSKVERTIRSRNEHTNQHTSRKYGITNTLKPPNETVHQPLPGTLFRGFKDSIGLR